MAKKVSFSAKQLLINKANTQTVVMTAVAAFIVVFSIVASRALLSQRAYQSRVIKEKETAVKQLKGNISAVSKLVSAYTQFQGGVANIIGGSTTGKGQRDGDNAKIVLDALPSQYDFPALATSLETILEDPNYTIGAITGTDDELAQKNNTGSPKPQPIEMPFEISVSGSYASVQNLVFTLEKSVRPFKIDKLDLSGKDSSITATIHARTYYQPEKNLTIRTKEIK